MQKYHVDNLQEKSGLGIKIYVSSLYVALKSWFWMIISKVCKKEIKGFKNNLEDIQKYKSKFNCSENHMMRENYMVREKTR